MYEKNRDKAAYKARVLDGIVVIFKLSENFYQDHLVPVMEDEFDKAQQKWNRFLTQEEKDTVVENVQMQLTMKSNEIYKFRWNLWDEILVLIANTKEKVIEMDANTVLDDELAKMPILHTRTSLKYDPELENKDRTVLLGDLHADVVATLEKWARTAVFYGVASYA